MTRSFSLIGVAITLLALLPAREAEGQISASGGSFPILSTFVRGSAVAYDPKNDVYLTVAAYGPVEARFVRADGTLLSAYTLSTDGFAHYPAAAYSPEADGGRGGFLVSWHHGSAGDKVGARIVSFASGLIGSVHTLGFEATFQEAAANVAYSTVSKNFLVVWMANYQIRGALISHTNELVQNGIVISTGGGERDPSIAYNSSTDKFLVAYSGFVPGAHVSASLVNAATGGVSGPQQIASASGTYITDATFFSSTGKYFVAWSQLPGGPMGRFVDASGMPSSDIIPLSNRFMTYDSLSVDYNALSRTAAAVGQDLLTAENGGVEITDAGSVGVNTGLTSLGGRYGNFYPQIAASTTAKQWLLTTAHDFGIASVGGSFAGQFVVSGSTDVPPPPPPPSKKVRGDYDGDAKADVTIYRPSTGQWFIKRTAGGAEYDTMTLGDSQSLPVPGDYDGDGKGDIGVWQPSTGQWTIKLSSTNYTTQLTRPWGDPSFKPVQGDYDGDGRTDIAVFRPVTGIWWILTSSSGFNQYYTQGWGDSNSREVPGDYDGDGKTDIAVWNSVTGVWWVLLSSSNNQKYWTIGWGDSTFKAVQADYDGDGKTDIAVWRPSTGYWWILTSTSNYYSYFTRPWGDVNFVAVPGDYDGDGKADITVWHPPTGYWWVMTSASDWQNYVRIGSGGPGDMAVGGIIP